MPLLKFDPFPVMTTDRLVLRKPALTDDNETFFLRSDGGVNKYVDRPRAQSIDDARQFLQKLVDGIDKNEWISWAINMKGNDQLLGSVCLWNIDKERGAGEIGFELLPAAEGQGIMSEAIVPALEYAFGTMGLSKIEGWVHRENKRSVRLMDKSGFERDVAAEEKHAGKDYFNNMVIYTLERKTERMHKPEQGEYNAYFQGYIDIVPGGNFVDILHRNTQEAIAFFEGIPAEKHNYRYDSDKWSVKELLVHLTDAERVFSYRALVAARGDSKTILHAMDDHLYVQQANVAGRTFESLVADFKAVRAATERLYEPLSEAQCIFKAKTKAGPITARALGYITVGHMMHHMKVIKAWYL